jgi:hypothetical protein
MPLRTGARFAASEWRYSWRPAQNALRAADLKTVGEVREMSDQTLISLPDFGRGSLSDLRG